MSNIILSSNWVLDSAPTPRIESSSSHIAVNNLFYQFSLAAIVDFVIRSGVFAF